MTDLPTGSVDEITARNHVPVMLSEVLNALEPDPGKTIIDGTFGAGGYSKAIVDMGASVIGIDRDPNAIESGKAIVDQFGGQINLVRGTFSKLDALAEASGIQCVHGVVLDIGVSSMQLDQAERGFSFGKDGPLDMRMSSEGISAADVVNAAPRRDLTRIIGLLGEEKKAGLVSSAIEKARKTEQIISTLQLSRLIEKALGRHPKAKIHPATRTFQALRIFVNRELEELVKALFAAERILIEGGRLVVVTFHSLEDRIVKQFFSNRSGSVAGSRHLPESLSQPPTFDLQKNGAIKASEAEVAENPRARSAKLRFGIRTNNASRDADFSIFGLPNLISLEGAVGLNVRNNRA